jgi:multimeric flavodoxin WrbA
MPFENIELPQREAPRETSREAIHEAFPKKASLEAPHKTSHKRASRKASREAIDESSRRKASRETSHKKASRKASHREAPHLLAIYGSPRDGGNTDVLLDHFLKGVSDSNYAIERVYLRNLQFSPCTECEGCAKTGECIIHDDMDDLYAKLLEDERVVLAFPVFFLGPPAIAKAFIDRAQALWVRRFVLGAGLKDNEIKRGKGDRKGFFLSLAGFRGSGKIFSCSISIVRAFYAACNIRYTGELTMTGVDRKGDIERHPELLEMAVEAGRRFTK